MFEGPRQREQTGTRKTQLNKVATDAEAALNWTSRVLGRLKEFVDGLKVLDRLGRLVFA